MNIEEFLGDLSVPEGFQKEEFFLDFLITEIESDKLAYINIINAIDNISELVTNDPSLKQKEIYQSLLAESQKNMKILLKNVALTMTLNDSIITRYSELDDSSRVKQKSIELYNISSQTYKLCQKMSADIADL